MTNQKLTDLYTEFFSGMEMPDEVAAHCSLPLLIHMPNEEAWATNQSRILCVGQETHSGWGGQEKLSNWMKREDKRFIISGLMEQYEGFKFAEPYPSIRNSPFWRAFWQLGAPQKGEILWSELIRFDYDGGSVIKKDPQRNTILKAQNGLLRQEIELLNPTAIVFFTGPHYDIALEAEFGDINYSPVGNHPARQFARLNSDTISVPVYRLYHPAYLQRKKLRESWITELCLFLGK